MIGWLNAGSIVLGLIAWILPVMILSRVAKQDLSSGIIFSMMISMSACMISLLFQIINNYNRVVLEDWGALIDISGTRAFLASLLVIVTIILNGIMLIIFRSKTVK